MTRLVVYAHPVHAIPPFAMAMNRDQYSITVHPTTQEQKLSLRQVGVKKLPDLKQFYHNPKLTCIDLTSNGLVEFPSPSLAPFFPALTTFVLEWNKIATIPKEIVKFKVPRIESNEIGGQAYQSMCRRREGEGGGIHLCYVICMYICMLAGICI